MRTTIKTESTISVIGGCLAMMILTLLASLVNPAFSQLSPVSPPKGGFKIDGYLRANVTTQGGDWVPRLNSQTFTASEDSFVLSSSGVPKDAITTRLKTDLYNSSSDSIFAQGSKFNDHISALHWSTGSAPDKNDINNGVFHATGDLSGNQWVFIGGDRLAVTGTSYIDFEFLQDSVAVNSNGTFTGYGPNGGRRIGDINISMEYNNGGTAPKVVIYRWKLLSGTTYYWDSTGSSTITDAYAKTNLVSVDVPFGAFGNTTYQAFAFVEAAINITQLISLGNTGANCGGLSIKTLWIKTKASSSSTAALKDFMSPISLDLNFGGVNIDQKGPVCVNGSNITLTATPSGGTFSGPGVSGTTFSPSTAGVGHHQIIYTATVGSNCEKKDTMFIDVYGLPSLAPTIGDVCAGATTASLSYNSVSNSPNQYKIDWDATANTAGLSDITSYTSLGSSPFNLTIPGTLAAATYSGTMYVKNTTTTCENSFPISLKVNAKPAQPAVNVTQPTCSNSNGTVTVTSPLDGGGIDYEYSNNGGAWQEGVSFTVASNGAYSIVARNKTTLCESLARTGTMGAATATPDAVAVITQNVDCSHSTGTVRIKQASAGNPAYNTTDFEFSNNNSTWGSSDEFTFAAGGGYHLYVRKKSDHTCVKDVSCEAETPSTKRNVNDVLIELNSQPSVVAAPNPFNDKIRFSLKSGFSGQGTLELYNMLGQKVRTVFQGQVTAGQIQTIEYSVPGSQRANLIYVFTVGGTQTSGKLINLK
jgi:hypothetical protein